MALPGFDYTAPETQPVRSWLYDAATIIPVTGTSVRVLEGVRVWPVNCGPSGTWPSDPCAPIAHTVANVTLTGATTGAFTLTVAGQTTDPIAFNASIAAVEAAIEDAAPGVDAVVTGAPGAWVVTFLAPNGDVTVTGDQGTADGVFAVVVTAGTAKGGARPSPSDLFDPLTIWAWDECGAGEDEETVRARALHLLELNEIPLVESAFAERLVADAGAAVSSGVDPRHAMTLVAQSMRAAGVRGVIHADMPKVSHAQAQNSINDSGALTLRPFGNPIATGEYEALGDLIIGTGPVFIWRAEATVQFVFDRTHNIKMALAERVVLVAYEPCFIEAREAIGDDSSPSGGGGPSGLVYPAP